MSESPKPQIPDHEVLRIIGRGAYGQIWLARSLTGALRAVKVVYRDTFESERAFNREFLGMSAFEPISRAHEGFVDILHVGRTDAFFYYIMELADDHSGGPQSKLDDYSPKTLKSEIERRKRLPVAECLALGRSLADALHALHAHRLTHRDIKPANIIFVNGVPKLADIGLVAASGQRSFVGTEGYVPPEGPGTPQADIYSLGKVLYEISMGKDRLDFPEIATNLDGAEDENKQLMRLNQILLRACANDMAKRYETAQQMHDDLALAQDGKRCKRGVPWALLAIPVLVAMLAIGALFYSKTAPAPAHATIRTEPPGAMVLLGDMMKKSPAEFDGIEPGKYRLRVMMPGFDAVDSTIEIKTEKTSPPVFKLRRSKGSLRLVTEPAGASFELRSGQQVLHTGTTPAALGDLPTGSYDIVVRREDRELRESVEIKRDETTSKELVFADGMLDVASEPPDAEIFIDGKSSGHAPLHIELPTGSHQIAAKLDDWPPEQQPVAITKEHATDVRFTFANGSVKITSAPGAATVLSRDGRKLGQTPLLIEEVKPGEVFYELRLAGYKPAHVAGTVQPKAQAFLAARLDRRLSPEPGAPFTNSLGMKFVPVGDTRFCIWETRVRDYEAFCAATGQQLAKRDFAQTPDDPVVKVSWHDAHAFCKWLTDTERAQNLLEDGQSYRLPTDLEWSMAAGLPDEGGSTPEERDGKIKGEFPWGKTWPPPAGAGNYADQSVRRTRRMRIEGYNDGFEQTSPVGSFAANSYGIYDLGGNVWEWTEDGYNGGTKPKDWGVLRGGSWANSTRGELESSYRNVVDRNERDVIYGFRCVLVSE